MYNILIDFDMPEVYCNACHESRFGEKLKANGRCTRCDKSIASRRKLSPDNDMDLEDLPDVLKDLYLVETLAISLEIYMKIFFEIKLQPGFLDSFTHILNVIKFTV